MARSKTNAAPAANTETPTPENNSDGAENTKNGPDAASSEGSQETPDAAESDTNITTSEANDESMGIAELSDADKARILPVKFIAIWGSYTKGEVAGFPADKAIQLVKAKIAEPYETE